MPFYYDPSPDPSPRSQAQAVVYRAIDSLNEVRNDPFASAEELEDMKEAYQTARNWFKHEVDRETEAQGESEAEASREAEVGQ